MVTDIKPYLDKALRERAEAQVEIAAAMMRLTADELAESDASVWAQLAPANRRDILRRLGSAKTSSSPEPATFRLGRGSPPPKQPRAYVARVSFLRRQPAVLLGAVVGLTGSTICAGFFYIALVVAPGLAGIDSEVGSLCTRLMLPEQGCYYRVHGSALSWSDAAAQIGVNKDALKAGNHGSTDMPLMPGTLIFISREMADGARN